MDAGRSATRKGLSLSPGMTDPVCSLDEIPDGGTRGVLPDARGRHQVLIVRQGPRVYAYVNNCPHYDRAPLGWKQHEFLSGDKRHIMCSAHGALFRIEDGACELGPCLGQSLTAVATEVRDGSVFLTGNVPHRG